MCLERIIKPALTSMADVEIMEEEEAVFETIITGKPPPKVDWYSGSTRLNPSDRVSHEKEGFKHRLVLRDCQVTQTGLVTAKAANKGGTAAIEANLLVKGSDICITILLHPLDKDMYGVGLYTRTCMCLQ